MKKKFIIYFVVTVFILGISITFYLRQANAVDLDKGIIIKRTNILDIIIFKNINLFYHFCLIQQRKNPISGEK